ncbi:MAG: hypothetical protein ACTSU5_11275 [Promethearchaeota archaeon]
MTIMYRQGDVLLRKVDDIPKYLRHQPKTNVLVEGEVTGHAHRALNCDLFGFTEFEISFLKAKEGAKLVHEEHGPIDLEPGCYEVVRQMEYDPAKSDWRRRVED